MSFSRWFLERYRPGGSFIHRADPRPKLVVTLAFIAAVTAIPAPAWPAFLALGALVALFALASRVPVASLLKAALLAFPFVLVAVPTVFTRPGEPMFQVHVLAWTLSGTREGLAFFLSVLVKAVLSVTAAGLLAATTRFEDVSLAMRFLRMPRVLVAIVSSTYRYLFVLVEEAAHLNRARLARSARRTGKKGGTILWRARVAGGMVGSLFLRTYERSERIYQAMLARGFDGELRSLSQEPLSPGSWAAMASLLLVLLGVGVVATICW